VLGRLAASEKRVKEREAIRAELVKKVPVPVYRRYEMIRSRRGTAIASTTDGTCSGVPHAPAAMLFQDLTRGKRFRPVSELQTASLLSPGRRGGQHFWSALSSAD